jgi:hypothetical protein
MTKLESDHRPADFTSGLNASGGPKGGKFSRNGSLQIFTWTVIFCRR